MPRLVKSSDLRTRAAAALIQAGPDSVLTSHTAVYLYGCRAADDTPIHIALPYRKRSSASLVIHRGVLNPRHVETLYGLRVLALEHSLTGMLCRADSPTAFACLDQALAMQPEGCLAGFLDRLEQSVRIRADPRGRRRASVLLRLATGLSYD